MNPILKRTLTGLAVGGAVICAALFSSLWAIYAACALLFGCVTLEYVQLLRRKVALGSLVGLLAVLAALPAFAAMFLALAYIAARYGNVMLLYIIAVVKFSDVGGFAVGLTSNRLMKGGNHKMCPSVSPNKSWEGMAGSVLFSCVVSLAFMPATGIGAGFALALGVLAAFIGTFGDLVESKFKRWVGVKDSSAMKITNGMGGFLDMFDSMLFAPAAILLALRFFA